jgi:peptidoglycan hydrolase CwlO-like protein
MTKTISPAEFVRPATDFEVMQQEHIERLKAELAEARAEIERLKEYTTCTLESADANIDDKDVEIIKRDKLIEQMKSEIERLKRCCNCEYANHKLEICEHPDNEPETFMHGVCDFWSHDI